MRPRILYSNSSCLRYHLGVAVCLLLFLCASLNASSRAGSIIARANVSPEHRNALTKTLGDITGWKDLRFDAAGFLQIMSDEFESGSSAARKLIQSAIGGKKIIIIEDASSRSDVAFCRVVPGRWVGPSPRPEQVFVILVDFTDFERITGDNKARAAFNVGWGFLHELDHVVNDSEDPYSGSASIGECEDHINQMRLEVGVPLRAGYFFSPWPVGGDPNFTTRLVRLSFVEKKTASDKAKRYWLVWDATLVGGSTEQWQTALVQALH